MRGALWILTLAAAAGLPRVASAQQDARQKADSLEREVRLLTVRLDSLERVLARLVREGQDTTPVVDELAALRAAAREAGGGTDTTAAPSQPAPTASGGGLNRLNPEISATGDVRFLAERPGPQQDNVDVREFEFSFQSALDPYASTKIFITFEDGQFDLEEGYAYWSALPGGFRADLGRVRQQVGELNRWHLHALPETEYPLVLREYFGEEGLVGNGLSVYWIAPFHSPGGGTHELWGQISLANNEVLFDEGARLSYLGHVNNFWQLSSATFVQVGGTALYGTNPDVDLKTTVLGADFRLTWRPPARALFRSFTLRGEGYAIQKEFSGVGDTRYGSYLGADYQLSRRLFAGARFDYVQPVTGPDDAQWAIVPRLTWWQSEWVYLRAEWQHNSIPIAGLRETGDRFVLQVVWAMGPHKHETY